MSHPRIVAIIFTIFPLLAHAGVKFNYECANEKKNVEMVIERNLLRASEIFLDSQKVLVSNRDFAQGPEKGVMGWSYSAGLFHDIDYTITISPELIRTGEGQVNEAFTDGRYGYHETYLCKKRN